MACSYNAIIATTLQKLILNNGVPTMKPSHQYPRRILLAVSGMSPQILTETLYALAFPKNGEPFVPTEVHLITTQEGARRAKLELLHQDTGQFYNLCRDYQLQNISFPESHIYVITDASGALLDDIKTPEHNEAAADFITEKMSRFTRDDNAAIHVSIAGGRKTMGYYLGYALSLFGRPQDRLSHVLVSEKYENHRDFYYPTKESHVIRDRDDNPLDTKLAEVMLAEIPFVRLRGGIPPEHLLSGRAGFSESINLARSLETGPLLKIDRRKHCFYANGYRVDLTGINFTFYYWMIRQTVEFGERINRPRADKPNKDYSRSFLAFYRDCINELDDIDKTEKVLANGMTPKWLSERMSAIKKAFEKAIGEQAAEYFAIESQGTNYKRSYSVPLKMEQIELI